MHLGMKGYYGEEREKKFCGGRRRRGVKGGAQTESETQSRINEQMIKKSRLKEKSRQITL